MNIRNSKQFSNAILIFLSLTGLVLCNLVNQNSEKPFLFVSKQSSSLNIDKKFWSYFHLGQKRLISSLFWISTILESDIEHYKGKNLNSWMYLRFETISLLDPNFLETYTFGGPYLSIIKDDLEGATQIYKKGIVHYPQNYSLLKNAAFHFHYEVENYDESFRILNLLKQIPNVNQLLLTSLARIESSNGNIEGAFSLLSDIYIQLKDKNNPIAEKILSDLYSIRTELDLDCLNNKKANCNLKDLNEVPYRKNEKTGKYESVREWKLYRIKKKKP